MLSLQRNAYDQVVDHLLDALRPDDVEPSADEATEPAPPGATLPVIRTDAELAAFLSERFGVRIPDRACCAAHTTPWKAFSDAYFARHPVTVWKASRGFGGKSFTLGLLALVEAITLKADVTVLGGSGEQSTRVLTTMDKLWSAPAAPREVLASDPAKRETKLIFGNAIQALMASTRSARGPHPQRLRLDEVDEMKLLILDAAMGQTMAQRGIPAQTVISSTHHYPDATMTEVLKRAGEKGWPVYEWCWRENVQSNGGWLLDSEVARKRIEVTAAMWEAEYDLQEPNPEGRAIVVEKVREMFDRELGSFPGADGQEHVLEAPVPEGRYATGADWAKSADWTVVITVRTDVTPMRLVAFQRIGRRPWPQMVAVLNDRLARYGGAAAHDATGLGTVVADLLTHKVEDVTMVGRTRADLFSEYIKAIERNELVAPFIDYMEGEHRFAKVQDLYGAGHPPDSIVAGALAYRAAIAGIARTPEGALEAGAGSGPGEDFYEREL